MSYENLKNLTVNQRNGKIVITYASDSLSPHSYQRWVYHRTCNDFERKLIYLGMDILNGHLRPLPSCSHQKFFSLLFEALESIRYDTSAMDREFLTNTDEELKDYISKSIAVPYFTGKDIDMDSVREYIQGPLTLRFKEEYKEGAKRKKMTFYDNTQETE